MVVDDDPFVLITMRDLFEPDGYEVLCVNSGQDCLDELARVSRCYSQGYHDASYGWVANDS
jgi:CheY-like chemotaxis protein